MTEGIQRQEFMTKVKFRQTNMRARALKDLVAEIEAACIPDNANLEVTAFPGSQRGGGPQVDYTFTWQRTRND